MDQGGRVEAFECARRVEHVAEFAPEVAVEVERAHGLIAENSEACSNPFAACEEALGLVEKGERIAAERRKIVPMLFQGVSNALLKKPCESRRLVHSPSLARLARRRMEGIEGARRCVMGLSEREQQLLADMERRLYQSEADVMRTSEGSNRRINLRSLVLGIVVVLAGVGVLIGGVAAQQLWLGLIGFAVMLGGTVLAFTRTESAGHAEKRPADVGGKPSGESFGDRMNRRWDERMGGER